MRFTVFTPTYNRAHTLPRVYDSLCRQTFQDFEWVVVDDGSTDQTAALLDEITARHHGFPIRVLTTPNGGKHRAINTGVGAARGELFFIVDSDDHLPDDSLAVVDAVERSIPAHQRARFAGVCGLKGYPDGRPIGTTFDGETLDITTLERDAHGIAGDKAEVFHTDIMRAYPFPEFPGEHFLPEAVVWDRIAHDGKRLREDGLTRRYGDLLHENPRRHGLFLRQRHHRGKVPARLAIGQCLRYFDDQKDELSVREISQNLGVRVAQLQCWRFLRRLRRLFPSRRV